MTKERTFKKKGGQLVHGSYFTRISFTAVTEGSITEGSITVYAEVRAEQPGSFRFYLDRTGPYANRTSVELPGVSLSVTPKNELVVHKDNVETRAKWKQLHMPLNAAGEPVPGAAKVLLPLRLAVHQLVHDIQVVRQ